jgi:Domain of unknown function (DUF222)
MSEPQVDQPPPPSVEVAVKALTDAVDGLLAVDLTTATRDDLLDLARGLETQRRRLPVADHALIGELDQRGVAAELACRSTAALLRQLLRLTPGQARGRVDAAAHLGPRRALTGEPLPPRLAAVAAAQADGTLDPRHAEVIVDTLHALPAAVAAARGQEVVDRLVAEARRYDPTQLATLARRLVDALDPDGTPGRDADHARRRDLTLTRRRDGSGQLTGRRTPGCLAVWQNILDALAAPAPATDTTPDPRTPGQRRHDALHDAGRRLLSADLPDTGGAPVTVLVTMTVTDLETRLGQATTAHGGTLSVPAALRLAADAHVIPVVLGDGGGILGYGRSRRCASPAQRAALAARDKGCTFPACDIPPTWTQVHHVLAWADGGHTDLDQMTLLCGHHHRTFQARGWTCTMIRGVPHWTPPPWLDPTQTPRRNTMHDP